MFMLKHSSLNSLKPQSCLTTVMENQSWKKEKFSALYKNITDYSSVLEFLYQCELKFTINKTQIYK